MNGKQAKALLIEDDPLYARAIQGLFMARGVAFSLEIADTLANGITRLTQPPAQANTENRTNNGDSQASSSLPEQSRPADIDIILLDLALPDSEGLETFTRLRAVVPTLPIIVLTSTNDDEIALQAMQAGAQDYLVKGEINRHLLQRAMRYAIERQRGEVALRETQRLMQEIADITPEIINIYDLEEQRTIYVNRQLATILGYATGKLHGLTPHDWVAPDDAPRLVELFEGLRNAQDGEIRELEYRARHQNGEWRWLRSEFTAFARNQGGQVRQVLISSHDVTQRRVAEEALRNSEERYRDLVENGGLYVATHDTQGQLLSANQNVLKFLGIPDFASLPQRDLSEFLPDELRPQFADYLQKVLATGQAHGVAQFQTPDGQVRLIEFDNSLRQSTQQTVVRCIGRDVTERVRAAEAVRSSEDRYQDVVENSGLLIGTHDSNGDFINVNQTTWQFLGCQNADELVGRNIRDILTPTARDEFDHYLAKVFASGRHQGTMSLLLADGSARLLEYDNSVRQDQPAGEPVVRFIARDITERYENEQKIRESEEQFRLIAENSTDMIGRYSLTGETLYVSPALTRLLGYEPQERLGCSVYELFHPDDVEMVRQAHRALLENPAATPITTSIIYRYRHKDGHYVWLESNARALRDDATGKLEYVQAVTRDVSERKQAEDVIRNNEERYRDLFEHANDIVFTTDINGKITSFNHTGEVLTGHTRDEVLNQGALAAFQPEFKKIAHDLLESKLAGKSKTQYELALDSKTGQHLILEVSTRLIYKDNRPVGVQGIARDVTERKRVEAQIRENEERYRTLFEDANDVVFTLDFEGRFTSINAAGERLLGYTRDELQATAFTQIATPAAEQTMREMLQRKLAGAEQQTNYEIAVNTRKGTPVTLEVSSRLIYKDHQPVGLQAIARDVTERKRIEAERAHLTKERDAERMLLQAVLKQMPAGVMISEAPSEKIVLVNENAVKILRCTSKELREGLRLEAYHLNGKRIRTAELPLTRAIRSGEVVTGEEMFLRRSDGALVTVRVEAAPIQRGGSIVAGVMAFSDITERKLADEQIREQAALLDCAQDAIAVLDLDGRIMFWNRGAERLYGWSRADVMYQSLEEMLLPAGQAQWLETVQQQLNASGEWKGEVRQLTATKQELVVESRCTLVRDESGKPKSILIINTDITQRKLLESQLLRMQRTESIGSLASGIAHDLNNALAPILMALHTLQQKYTDASDQRWLGLIRKSAERSRDLVDQVLTFARGVSGERLLLAVDEVVNETAKILRETLPKSITLTVEMRTGIWRVMGDRTQLNQVLMNLCINARDAMPGGGRLKVGLSNVSLKQEDTWMHEGVQPGPFVQLVIKDTGTGIPPEILNRIFDPFFTTKDLGKGTGLGLSTSLGIIKGHGGFINVDSVPGSGTEFKVYLPVAVENAQPVEALPAVSEEVAGDLVLAVDDEPMLLEVTKATLETAGYRVLAVSDGRAAVTLFEQHHDDIKVVLTDLSMPGLDGLAASNAMRSIKPAVKIIATSGLRSAANIEDANRAGVKAVLWKPYTADDLLDKIAEVIRQ